MGWQSGHKIGARFVIEGRLAMGGMAQVYVAEMHQARGLTRKVALKRVHPHLAEDPEFVTMFIDEARIMGQLAHPGIVPVVDAIEHAGDLMLVMDYVPGWDLKAVLDRARARHVDVPLGVAAQIALRAAETLAYVHTARATDGTALAIVHRDVTPSNLLAGTDGRVRLLDFGVAKAARRSTKTATRAIKGKLAYLSPEQARGDGASSRSDVYALGLVLWEMLVGRRAISGDDDFAIMRRAASPDLEPIALHRPDSPEALDAVVARMLAVDAGARADASEIARTIAPYAGGDASVARFVETVMEAPARPVEAGRSSVDQALLSVLAEGTFSGVSLAGQRITRPPAEPDLEVAPAVAGAGAGAATVRATPSAARAPDSLAGPDASGPRPSATPTSVTPAPSRRGAWAIGLVSVLLVGLLGFAAYRQLAPDETAPDETAPAAPRSPDALPASPPGFVRVTSTPPGATVLIDGEAHAERTPTVLEAPAGAAVELTLRLDDHADETATVTPAAGETTHVERSLRRRSGQLEITSRPSGATVTIDGEERGRTPLTLRGLPRETLAVRIEAEGPYRPYETRVDLDAAATERVDARLTRVVPRGGTLTIMAIPPNVRVRVDDGPAVRPDAWPHRPTVSPGRHTVVVSNPSNGRSARRSMRPGQSWVGIDLR